MKAINKMYELFGKNEQFKCRTCNHLTSYKANRRWYKCEVYGASSCASSDWRLKWTACGMYNKPYDGREIRKIRFKSNQPEAQIDGQMEWKL